VCDLETSRIGAPYIYNVRLLRVKFATVISLFIDAIDDNAKENDLNIPVHTLR